MHYFSGMYVYLCNISVYVYIKYTTHITYTFTCFYAPWAFKGLKIFKRFEIQHISTSEYTT